MCRDGAWVELTAEVTSGFCFWLMIQNTANFFGGIFIVGKTGISYNENDYREVSLEGVSYDD